MLVKIFSRDDCSFCSQAKQFLNGMEIEFEEEYTELVQLSQSLTDWDSTFGS